MDEKVPASLTLLSMDAQAVHLPEPEPQLDVLSIMDDLDKSESKEEEVKTTSRRTSFEVNEVETRTNEVGEKGMDVVNAEAERSYGGVKEEGEEKAVWDETVVDEQEKEMHELGMKVNELEKVGATVGAVTITSTDSAAASATTAAPVPACTAAAALVNDQVRRPSLERKSLVTIRASGTRAVGSLFSRFKGGRTKKSAEPSSPSILETAAQVLEVPKEAGGDDSTPMTTKRELDGKQEQSSDVVSGGEKKDDFSKLAVAAEKEIKQGTVESHEVPRHKGVDANDGNTDFCVHESMVDLVCLDGEEISESTDVVSRAGKLSDVTNSAFALGIVESAEKFGGTTSGLLPGEIALSGTETLGVEILITPEITGSDDGHVVSTKCEDEFVSPLVRSTANETTDATESIATADNAESVSQNREAQAGFDVRPADMQPLQAEAKVSGNSGTLPDEVANGNFTIEVSEKLTYFDTHKKEDACVVEVTSVEPLVAQIADTVPMDEITLSAAVATHTDAAVVSVEPELAEITALTESSRSKALLTNGIELLQVVVAPSPPKLSTQLVAPAKPKQVSPVKRLTSRFEGKREQSLDSLKFRTVRGFFPDERSVHVGAEKEKYEAHAQQQKLNAKAEQVIKSKYKTASGSKSFEKDPVPGAMSFEFASVTMDMENEAVLNRTFSADSCGFMTPDATASRKKLCFDDANSAVSSSPQLSGDTEEALTPVKSIASRFEGKREQSLDALKFRTVREFFPVERSVHVDSEKQKLEAHAQLNKSLDTLKFRTVREFFPDEGKRSIHVGAEKAKFEALTRPKGGVTKAAETVKRGSAGCTPSSTTVTCEESKMAFSAAASSEAITQVLDHAHDETATTGAASCSEMKKEIAVKSAETGADVIAATALKEVSDVSVSVEEVSVEVEANDIVACLDTEGDGVNKEETHSSFGELPYVKECKAAAAVKIAQVGSKAVELPVIVDNGPTSTQGNKTTVDADCQYTLLATAENFCAAQNGRNKLDNEETVEGAQDFGPERVTARDKVDVKEAFVVESTALDTIDTTCSVVEQANSVQTSLAQVVKSMATQSELVEKKVAQHKVVEKKVAQREAVEKKVAQREAVETKAARSDVVEFDCTESEHIYRDASVSPVGQIAINGGEAGGDPRVMYFKVAASLEKGPVQSEQDRSVCEMRKEIINREVKTSSQPMLTTERSFVIEDDHTIDIEDTVVVKERPMTDGEEDFEALSQSRVSQSHESYSDITSTKTTESSISNTVTQTSPKVTHETSAGLVGSDRSSLGGPVAPVVEGCAFFAPSHIAKKATEAEDGTEAPPHVTKKSIASMRKSTVSENGSTKAPITTATASAPLKRASFPARLGSRQAVNNSGWVRKGGFSNDLAPRTQSSKRVGLVGFTSVIKPASPVPTVYGVSKRVLTAATTAARETKNGERCNDVDVPLPSISARTKSVSSVKSNARDGIQTDSVRAVTHKTITREAFIAAERRKSFGSAGVRCIGDANNRRVSLTARAAIGEPPEPYVRSALSRKKLNSTVPRYMNYENAPGYAERARQQYERRKRLEAENAARSEKRQRELRSFFDDKQQKSLMTSADIVRRGLEAHEFAKMVKEGQNTKEKTARPDRQGGRATRSHCRAPSSTSSECTSSSNGASSRASKRSFVLCAAEKAVITVAPGATIMTAQEVAESVVVKEEVAKSTLEEEYTETQEAVISGAKADKQTLHFAAVDEDLSPKHVARTSNDDETRSAEDKNGLSNE
uniref:Uncharacterized protein n=1 Tax=Peronospora matthiolae TaxID=2874970 RepID=A0AAV1TUD0_9STRA